MRVARAAFVIAFLSVAVTTAPALVALLKEPRRDPLHEDIEKIKRAIPPSEPLALITKKETDPALFANYDLYPRRTRVYAGFASYRNAPVATRPKTIIAVDYDRARLTTFAELRDEQFRGTRVMRGALEAAPRPEFIVPLAASLEGGVTDSYMTEADFENAGSTAATLRLTLMPQRIAKSVTIAPHATLSFHDLMYQNFGRTDIGWLRVDCDQPLFAALWLVNRGRNEGVRIPLVTSPRSGTIRCPGDDCLLWLENLGDERSVANVNGAGIVIEPGAIVQRPLTGEAEVSGENIYAFAGTRGGKTLIAWP